MEGVGVLVFVDEDAVEPGSNTLTGIFVGEKRVPIEEQIVVIEYGSCFLAIDVGAEEFLEFVFPFVAPGEELLEDGAEPFAGVDAATVDAHAGSLLGEPLVGLGKVEFGSDDVEEVFRVGSVVDRELDRKADRFAVLAEEPGGDGVKCPAPDACAAELGLGGSRTLELEEEGLDAAEHFGGSAAGEGEEEDAAGVCSLSDEVGDTVDEGGGLACARPGDDEEGGIAVTDGLPLLGVEPFEDFVVELGIGHGLGAENLG